ncbi:MAG: DUF167 family protein [Porticoccaceae bacterium]|nr:DUF167 family protein [Porticoccaceae bacterium]
MVYVEQRDDGLVLQCHIQPGASRDAIAGVHGDRLKVQVASPPVDGKANDRLVRFIAKTLGVAKSRITVVRGHSSRQKTLHIADLKALPDSFPR